MRMTSYWRHQVTQRKKVSNSNYRSLKRTPLRDGMKMINYSIAYYLISFFVNIAYSCSLQGIASVKFRWGGKFNYGFMYKLFLVATLKELLKSANICQSYSRNKRGTVFLTHSDTNFFCLHHSLYLLVSWAWWDWPLTWFTNHRPSVLWHCWLGHVTRKPSPKWPIMCRVGR